MCDGASGEIKGRLQLRQGPARGGRGNEVSRGSERMEWRDSDKRVKKQQCGRKSGHFGIWNR